MCARGNNTSTANKVSIKSFEDISETLHSLAKTQNLLFNKIQNLENKVNEIFNILKSKEQQIRFSTNELGLYLLQEHHKQFQDIILLLNP